MSKYVAYFYCISTAKYLHQDNSIVFKTIPENYDHSNLEHTQVEKPNNRAKQIVAVLKFCPFLHSLSFIIWRSILFFLLWSHHTKQKQTNNYEFNFWNFIWSRKLVFVLPEGGVPWFERCRVYEICWWRHKIVFSIIAVENFSLK